MRRHSAGFTLTELLVALAVGLYLSGLGLAAFGFAAKAIRRTEVLASKNRCLQQYLMLGMSNRIYSETAASGSGVNPVVGFGCAATYFAAQIYNGQMLRMCMMPQYVQMSAAISANKLSTKTPSEFFNGQKLMAFDPANSASVIFPTIPNSGTTNAWVSQTLVYVDLASGGAAGWYVGRYEPLYLPLIR